MARPLLRCEFRTRPAASSAQPCESEQQWVPASVRCEGGTDRSNLVPSSGESRANLNCASRRYSCHRAEHDERIHDLVIGLGQLASAREGGPARDRDV